MWQLAVHVCTLCIHLCQFWPDPPERGHRHNRTKHDHRRNILLLVAPVSADPPHLFPWCCVQNNILFSTLYSWAQTDIFVALRPSSIWVFQQPFVSPVAFRGASFVQVLAALLFSLSLPQQTIALSEGSSSEPFLNQLLPEPSWFRSSPLWRMRIRSVIKRIAKIQMNLLFQVIIQSSPKDAE